MTLALGPLRFCSLTGAAEVRVRSQRDHSVSHVLTMLLGLGAKWGHEEGWKREGVMTAYAVYPTQPVVRGPSYHTQVSSKAPLPLPPVGGSQSLGQRG